MKLLFLTCLTLVSFENTWATVIYTSMVKQQLRLELWSFGLAENKRDENVFLPVSVSQRNFSRLPIEILNPLKKIE